MRPKERGMGTNDKSLEAERVLRVEEKKAVDVVVGCNLKRNKFSLKFAGADFEILLKITLEYLTLLQIGHRRATSVYEAPGLSSVVLYACLLLQRRRFSATWEIISAFET